MVLHGRKEFAERGLDANASDPTKEVRPIRKLLAFLVLPVFVAGTPNHSQMKPKFGVRHHRCFSHSALCRLVDRNWGRTHGWHPKHHWRPLEALEALGRASGTEYEGYTTYYSEPRCDRSSGGYYGADGTHVYEGMVANDQLSMGTRVWIRPAILGKHEFTVHDRFGSGQPQAHFDVWVPCGVDTGNPSIHYRVIR